MSTILSTPEPTKPSLRSTFDELEPPPMASRQQRTGAARLVESVGLGLMVLALASSIAIVATAGDTLGVYNKTTLGPEFPLALWPRDFDLRPTVALVTCGTIMTLCSVAFLLATKVPVIKNAHLVAAGISYLAPAVSLVAALVGTVFFYGVDASETNSSLQSWSCQWASIDMDVQPHWETLCAESRIALYLTIMLIPLQVSVLGAMAWSQRAAQKQPAPLERKESPAMS
ncbi:hypothetical protein QTJ16_000890 [Diplocarpon rosae]|uniref:Uncharacterized protein n=1 Tax=Diplocarpon rosae TaxID=946125 RepID=A0AAD9T655_9HELO|nr:hypothetical protein QTJ16_000890 [Diplocarpon rosae]PBP15865.1 hypothetical protein BUE80_DR013380 [Diplocarpon rosae]